MSLIGPVASSSHSAAKAAARRARASEKLKAASALHASLPERTDSGTDQHRQTHSDALAHSGTLNDVPFRHATPDRYFTPAFLAQLLGQLLPNPERKGSSALSAYRQLYARIRICDRFL